MNILILLAVAAALFALRYARPNALGWVAAWWVGLYLALRYGIAPPLPSSILSMFMAIITLALVVYLTTDTARMEDTRRLIVRFLVDKKYTIPMYGVVVLLPLLVALKVYVDVSRPPQPPLSTRTIHPAPPDAITFKGKKIDLVAGDNPYRALEQTDRAAFDAHVANGRRVYFENCVFCHGDHMDGAGLFAHGYDPIPANFQDATTIAMLQESYLFWRIAKGGPGLPEEATPWASAMPAWEQFLTEEEIWDVILFLYDYTGHRPRAKETHE